MDNRQGQYWQIAKHRFLFCMEWLKLRCSNTVFFMFTQENCSRIKVNFLVLPKLETFMPNIAQYYGSTRNLASISGQYS